MAKAPRIIALATAWGPKFGGINSFNTELLRSLAILTEHAYDVICFVPRADDADRADAQRAPVDLRDLGMGLPLLPRPARPRGHLRTIQTRA